MCFFSQICVTGGSLTLPAGIRHTLPTSTIHYGGLTEVADCFPTLIGSEVHSQAFESGLAFGLALANSLSNF